MADAPFITGSEILQYHGDPALGYGAGVGYNYNPAITHPLEGVQSTIDTLQKAEAARNQADYQAKINEREKLLSYLSSSGESVFNQRSSDGKNLGLQPIPEDYKTIDEASSKINDYVVANPNATNRGNAWLRDNVRKRDDLLRNAGSRSHFLAMAMLEAANSPDPIERDKIIKNAQDQINNSKVTDFKQLNPYMKEAPVDDNFLPKDRINDKNNYLQQQTSEIDPTSKAELTKTHSFISGNAFNNSVAEIMASPQKTAAATRYANTYAPPYLNNPELAKKQVEEVDLINKDRLARGEKEIPQIFDVQIDAQGKPVSVKLKDGLNTAQIAYGLAIPNHAKVNHVSKIDKGVLEANLARAQAAQAYATANASNNAHDKENKLEIAHKKAAHAFIVDNDSIFKEGEESLKTKPTTWGAIKGNTKIQNQVDIPDDAIVAPFNATLKQNRVIIGAKYDPNRMGNESNFPKNPHPDGYIVKEKGKEPYFLYQYGNEDGKKPITKEGKEILTPETFSPRVITKSDALDAMIEGGVRNKEYKDKIKGYAQEEVETKKVIIPDAVRAFFKSKNDTRKIEIFQNGDQIGYSTDGSNTVFDKSGKSLK